MTALEFIATVVGIILGSSALTVLLNNLHDRWKIKQERKNSKEDKLEAKEDIVDDLQNATDSQEKKIEALDPIIWQKLLSICYWIRFYS